MIWVYFHIVDDICGHNYIPITKIKAFNDRHCGTKVALNSFMQLQQGHKYLILTYLHPKSVNLALHPHEHL